MRKENSVSRLLWNTWWVSKNSLSSRKKKNKQKIKKEEGFKKLNENVQLWKIPHQYTFFLIKKLTTWAFKRKGRESAYKRVIGKEHFKLLWFISIQGEHGKREIASESVFVCLFVFFLSVDREKKNMNFITSLLFYFYVYDSIYFYEYDELDHLHDCFGRCSWCETSDALASFAKYPST